jgi:uncharacterized protein YjbI with pentapeptide repeats
MEYNFFSRGLAVLEEEGSPMSEQGGAQSSTKQHRSPKTSTANQQNGKQARAVQRPANDDPEGWRAYWKRQGQLWRTEPEIDAERQKYLAEHRNITPNIEQGIYPFKNIKLSRADVEWLLATHDNGRGPLDWSEVSQWRRDGIDLRGADLRRVDLTYLPLSRMVGGLLGKEWPDATEKQREMAAIQLQGARFFGTHLEGAHLRFAHLENAFFTFTHLERTHLRGAYLIGADLREAYMQKVRLENAVLSDEKHIGPRLADAQMEGANLAIVNWTQVQMLSDEYEASQKKRDGIVKEKAIRLEEYEKAVRANRQLAVALQGQGLNEVAARFAYRAQLMQRIVFRRQRKIGQYLFSLFLDLLAGYGYKPWRSFLAYLLVITAFAIAYFVIGHKVGPVLSPLGSFVFSMTSFHGRGFFPGGIGLDDPLTVLAAIEAFVGLLIEVTFIATLTQRLFGK